MRLPRSPPPHRGASLGCRCSIGRVGWLIHHPSTVDCRGSLPRRRSRGDNACVSALRVILRRWLIRGLSKTHLAVYRLSRGRFLSRVVGMPVLLLTTTGRRSGKARTTPLTFFRDGTNLVVIASNGGADRPPDWALNLHHNPRAVVEIGTDKLTVQARTASAEERDRLWVGITATYSGYARYQQKTARQIPVLILSPDCEAKRR